MYSIICSIDWLVNLVQRCSCSQAQRRVKQVLEEFIHLSLVGLPQVVQLPKLFSWALLVAIPTPRAIQVIQIRHQCYFFQNVHKFLQLYHAIYYIFQDLNQIVFANYFRAKLGTHPSKLSWAYINYLLRPFLLPRIIMLSSFLHLPLLISKSLWNL